MVLPALDLDLLRTLQLAMQSGSFKQAAELVGRTQSAVSLQMKRLELQVGVPLFRRDGRSLALTEAGRVLLDYSQRLLALNDEAIQAASGWNVRGRVRVGLLPDFAETVLPATLAGFSRAHPAVEIDVQVDRSARLIDGIRKRSLELALLFSLPRDSFKVPMTRIGQVPMVWVLPKNQVIKAPVKLVLFEPPCAFRDAAIASLNRSRTTWKQTFSSPSLAGTWAAVSAGLGISLRTPIGVPSSLTTATSLIDARRLPSICVSLLEDKNGASPVVSRLKDVFVQHLQEQVAMNSR